MSNFIQQCLSRQVALEDIDDFIDQWHENPGNQSLHEFLGMTRDEYANWVADSSALPAIVKAHKYAGNSAPSALPGGPGA